MYRLILLQIILALFIEIGGLVLSKTNAHDNSWLYNIYALAESWVLGGVCLQTLSLKKVKKVIFSILVGCSVVWIIETIMTGFFTFNNKFFVVWALSAIVVFIYSLIANSVFANSSVIKQPFFLLAMGIVIYYASIIPTFGLLNIVIDEDSELAVRLYDITLVAAIIRYALTAAALYLHGRKAREDAYQ